METLSFLLGIGAGLILIGVAVIFSMYKKLNQNSSRILSLEESQKDIFNDLVARNNEIHRLIQSEIEKVNRAHDNIYHHIDDYSSHLNSTIDSRFDKLENKIAIKYSKK